MANLDRIVNVQINLNTTGVETENFSTLLICGVCELPNLVTTINDADDLLDMGMKSTDKLYKAAIVAFSQIPRCTEIKIGKFEEEKTIAENMDAICEADNQFYGIAIVDRSEENIKAMAEWAEGHIKMFFTQFSRDVLKQSFEKGETEDLGTYLNKKGYMRTAWWYHEDDEEFLEVAVASRCFTCEAGSETWALKKINGVSFDKLTSTDYKTIAKKCGNTFERFRNVSITQTGKVAGDEWIDVIRFRDWLVEQITVNVFKALIDQDGKLPFTDGGIAVIETNIVKTLQRGQESGGIARNEYDEDNNVNRGYTLSVPKASSFTSNEKARRVVDRIKFTARLAGAIHATEIRGGFTYENMIEA